MSKRILLVCVILVLTGCFMAKIHPESTKLEITYFTVTYKSEGKVQLDRIEFDNSSDTETFTLQTLGARIEVPNKFSDFKRVEFLGERLGYANVRITYPDGTVLEGTILGFPAQHQRFYGYNCYGKATIKLQDIQSIEKIVEEVRL